MCFSSKVCRSGVKGDVRVLPRLQSVRTQHRSVPEVYGVAGMPLSHRESQKHCAEWSAVHRGALLFLFMKSKSILYSLASYWIREPFFFFKLSFKHQLLTFDVASSSESPTQNCLHLFYKLTERRGPQVSMWQSSEQILTDDLTVSNILNA